MTIRYRFIDRCCPSCGSTNQHHNSWCKIHEVPVKAIPAVNEAIKKALEAEVPKELLRNSAAPKSPVLPTPAGVETTSDTRPEKARLSTRAGPADGVAGAGKAADFQSTEFRPSHSDHNPYRNTKYARNSDKL